MSSPLTVTNPKYIRETFFTYSTWRPFKLINQERGIQFAILTKLSPTEIVRDLLRDGTLSSNLGRVLRNERGSTNGWRYEKI